MRRECRERFPRHRGLAITTCITARVLCMPGSLTSGSLWSRWRGTRSRLSQCMHNLQFGISGKWPINSFDEYYDLKIVNGLAEGMPVYQQDLFQYIYFFSGICIKLCENKDFVRYPSGLKPYAVEYGRDALTLLPVQRWRFLNYLSVRWVSTTTYCHLNY